MKNKVELKTLPMAQIKIYKLIIIRLYIKLVSFERSKML
jgi:hypothetical protein